MPITKFTAEDLLKLTQDLIAARVGLPVFGSMVPWAAMDPERRSAQVSLEHADCKECGGEGELLCWGADFPEIGPETYAIHCEDCENEGPIRPSQAEASREWAMLGKRDKAMTISEAIDQGYLAFQQWGRGATEDKGRELNKLAKVVCPRKHEKWVHWDSRRDAQCYVDDCGLRMAYSGEMKLE